MACTHAYKDTQMGRNRHGPACVWVSLEGLCHLHSQLNFSTLVFLLMLVCSSLCVCLYVFVSITVMIWSTYFFSAPFIQESHNQRTSSEIPPAVCVFDVQRLFHLDILGLLWSPAKNLHSRLTCYCQMSRLVQETAKGTLQN